MKHEAPDGGRRRIGLGLLNSLDKGAGAERRTRAAALARDNFTAFLCRDGRWVEGRAAVLDGELTFVSVDGQGVTIVHASHCLRPGTRWQLARDRGMRLVRVHEIELITAEQTVWPIAVGKRELSVLLAAIA